MTELFNQIEQSQWSLERKMAMNDDGDIYVMSLSPASHPCVVADSSTTSPPGGETAAQPQQLRSTEEVCRV